MIIMKYKKRWPYVGMDTKAKSEYFNISPKEMCTLLCLRTLAKVHFHDRRAYCIEIIFKYNYFPEY